jgi:hypothetical protein
MLTLPVPETIPEFPAYETPEVPYEVPEIPLVPYDEAPDNPETPLVPYEEPANPELPYELTSVTLAV